MGEVFLAILYYIIWIPIKYIGIGIWWLASYPWRKAQAKRKEAERKAMAARREAERKAQAEKDAAARKVWEEREKARRKAMAEREEAKRKAQAEKDAAARKAWEEREEARRKAKAEKEEAERKILLAKEAQQKADIENYLKELNSFDRLSPERQKQLSKIQHLEFDLIEDAQKQIFNAMQDWLLSDPENNLKMLVIKVWCKRDSMKFLFTNYCNSLARNKEEISANTDLDFQFCRTALQMGFITHKAIFSYASVIGNYYLRTGIAAIACKDLIINRPCYFKSPIAAVAQRQSNGKVYYDMENATELMLYLFSDQFETLGNGHGSLPLSEIVDIQIDQKIKITDNHLMLLITLRNRPSLNFWCNAYTAVFLLALLPLMATQRLRFQ